MTSMTSFAKKIFPSKRDLAVSVVLGLAISITIYLGLLQRHFFSFRYLAYALLLLLVGTVFSAWINHQYLLIMFQKYPKLIKVFVLAVTLLLSLALLFNTRIQPLYYVLPDSQLEIRFSVPDLPENQEGVRLLWVETGQGYVHYTHMRIDGEWERVFGNTIFSPGQDVRLTWSGKVGRAAEIAFRHSEYDQPVEIIWNGESQIVNLNNPREPIIFIRSRFKIPLIYLLPYLISFVLSVGYGLFMLLVFLSIWKPKSRNPSNSNSWLLYMLPMLIVWGFSLMVFWPGIMSTDSLTQWGQGATGYYNDWQSAFHALLLAVMMNIWYSPAFVSIAQILLFSLVVAWGLRTFELRGVPKGILWGISILFAVFPSNVILSITLWKDIAYAIAFLWLTVIIANIALSQGDWAKKTINWISLGAAAFLVSVFRQNGVAVSALTLFMLPLIFRKHWKPLSASLVTAALLFALTKGPLYSAVKVDQSNTGQTNLIYLHHIAAHLDAGSKFESPDLDYLDSFMPLDEWEYWCCYVGTISFDGGFDRAAFLGSTMKNRNLALRLFVKKPLVDISHATCAGELSWKFENNQCYMKSAHGINTWHPGEVDWIGRNDYGLEDQSFLPDLVDPYVALFRNFGFLDDELVFYLRPAFWLYLAVFGVSAAAIRRNQLSLLAGLVPMLSQTTLLFLISFAPAYRYHYGTCLAGIYLLGMIFLPTVEKSAQ